MHAGMRRPQCAARSSAAALACAAAFLAGCATAYVPVLSGDERVVCAGGQTVLAGVMPDLASILPAAGPEAAMQPRTVELPSLPRWPGFISMKGPVYAMVEILPLVAQAGAPADAKRAGTNNQIGIGIQAGYRVLIGGTTALGVEFYYQASEHRNTLSDVPAMAERTGVGVRLNFRMDTAKSPFAVVGVGDYALSFEGLDPKYDLGGMGVLLGGGVDFIMPGNSLAVRAEAGLHLWDATDATGAGDLAGTLAFGVGALFSF